MQNLASSNVSLQINTGNINQTYSPFDIREHLEKLEAAKGKDHYICPVCGGNDLTIEPKTGKYQCWHGCECKDIREAISPWDEVKPKRNNNSNSPSYRSKKPKLKPKLKKLTLPASIPEAQIVLAKLPEAPSDHPAPNPNPFLPTWLRGQGVPENATETRYLYDKGKWVSRFEWKDENNPKGRAKTIRQGHTKPDGTIKWNKGTEPWLPYRFDEAIALSKRKWVLGLEGEPCVEAARSLQLVAITWQGSGWSIAEIKKAIALLKEAGTEGLVFFPDFDEAGQKKAQLIAEVCDSLEFPYLILDPKFIWAKMPHKGDIVDWVAANKNLMDRKEFIQRLESAIHQAVKDRQEQLAQIRAQSGLSESETQQLLNLPSWSQSAIASRLAEQYRPQLAWNTELQEWYRYSAETEGIWSQEPTEFVGRTVKAEVEAIASLYEKLHGKGKKPSYTINFIKGITALLKLDLAVRRWDEVTGLLPLLNGIFDLKTKKLIPHTPAHRLTWCLPYDYNPLLTCDPITDWLTNQCGGDADLVQLMRAFLLGILTGRTDWQKYLELIGPGGTGKGTFIRLAIALVGNNNTHTTTLKKLEEGRFETASIAGKRLVVINDSERYAGAVSIFKSLTGQDTLPYEVKFKQAKGGFTPTAMVIVAANETIQSSDYTSGLERRRLTVPMTKKIPSDAQKELIKHCNGEILGEFAPYIPGLLNWVLAMDEAEATRIIKNYHQAVPKLAAMKAQTLVESNPIADWLDSNIVYQENYRTNVGVAKRNKDNSSEYAFLNTHKWLYANYCEYSQSTGSKPISLRRFAALLSDLCQNQLGLNVTKGRDRNGSYFLGLKIREQGDEDPPLIIGKTLAAESEQQPTNITKNSIVMDAVTDNVTAESLASDKSDGCDGFLESKLKIDPKEKLDSSNQKTINKEILPSHPSHDGSQPLENQQLQPIQEPSQQPTQHLSQQTSQPVTDSGTIHRSEPREIDWKDLIAEINSEMTRLGWSEVEGKKYLKATYGQTSRHKLTGEQVLEFRDYLKKQRPSTRGKGFGR